jgi:hypothetical protein
VISQYRVQIPGHNSALTSVLWQQARPDRIVRVTPDSLQAKEIMEERGIKQIQIQEQKQIQIQEQKKGVVLYSLEYFLPPKQRRESKASVASLLIWSFVFYAGMFIRSAVPYFFCLLIVDQCCYCTIGSKVLLRYYILRLTELFIP